MGWGGLELKRQKCTLENLEVSKDHGRGQDEAGQDGQRNNKD